MILRLSGFQSGSSICYPLLIIKGSLSCLCGCANLKIKVSCFDYPFDVSICCDVCRRFKACVLLSKGKNTIDLTCIHQTLSTELEYVARPSSTFVRAVYVIFKGDTGAFQSPGECDNSLVSACKRIGTALRLIQSITAETLYAEVGERSTFRCLGDCEDYFSTEPTVNSSSKCSAVWCLYSSLTLLECRKMSEDELWNFIARELCQTFPHDVEVGKWLAILSCTKYRQLNNREPVPFLHKDIVDRTQGHCALGSGGLALFGSGTLYTWPEDLADLYGCLKDTRKVDRRSFMDDSAYRRTFWANYATSLGTLLHELGHCFDLDHTPEGFMRRGGDDSHLILSFPHPDQEIIHSSSIVAEEPYSLSVFQFSHMRFYENLDSEANLQWVPQARHKLHKDQSLWSHGRAFWGRPVAEFLINHKWFQETLKGKALCRSRIKINGYVAGILQNIFIRETDRTSVSADNGIRLVQLRLVDGVWRERLHLWNKSPPSSLYFTNKLPIDKELVLGSIVYHRIWPRPDCPNDVPLNSIFQTVICRLGIKKIKIVVMDTCGHVEKKII